MFQLKAYAFWDALTRRRTDGRPGFRLITPVYESERHSDAETRLRAFTRERVPPLDIPRKHDYHTSMGNPVSASFLPRAAAAAMERALRTSPVVVLLGARQTGKTTLLRSLPQLADRPYLTLDDFDLRTQADADPESVVRRAPTLVLDEVQRSRDLLIAVKPSALFRIDPPLLVRTDPPTC